MVRKFVDLINKIIGYICLRIQGIQLGEKCEIRGKIRVFGTHNIKIGNNVMLNSGVKNNPIGGDEKLILRTIDKGAIRIGNNVGISNSTLVAYSLIQVDDFAVIGGGCKIYDSDFHSIDSESRKKSVDVSFKTEAVHIKEGAFIGAHCIILKGVTIGKNSVVGAGAVVSKNVPDGEMWAGNPARFIRVL